MSVTKRPCCRGVNRGVSASVKNTVVAGDCCHKVGAVLVAVGGAVGKAVVAARVGAGDVGAKVTITTG
jgi:hypothetical protein